MSAQHTPGPWTPFILDKPLSEIPTYIEKCIAAGTGEEFFFVAAEMPDGAVDVCHVGNGPRREANARLIAAAPEMLDDHRANARLLSLVIHDLQGRVERGKLMALQQCLDRSLAVIAKVEGGAA